MRTTIDKLTVTKTFYHRERDIYGNRYKEPYERAVPRKVQLVTGWLRFAHYLIDGIIIALILFAVDFALLTGLNFSFSWGFEINVLMFNLIPSIDAIIVTVAYYFICEKTMQRTLGKFATNAVVINKYAEDPDAGSLIGRSFARLVPFEALSCLNDRGWHDRWSNTYVVTMQERDTLRKLLNEQQGVFISDRDDLLD